MQYMVTLTSLPTLLFIRASILFFLTWLAGYHHYRSRQAFIALQIINLIHMPATLLPTVFMCTPNFRVWDLVSNVESGCISSTKVVKITRTVVGLTVIGVLIDLSILLVPIRMVFNLRLSKKRKITVCGLFGIGLL